MYQCGVCGKKSEKPGVCCGKNMTEIIEGED